MIKLQGGKKNAYQYQHVVSMVRACIRPLGLILTEGHRDEGPQMPAGAKGKTDHNSQQPDLTGITVEAQASKAHG